MNDDAEDHRTHECGRRVTDNLVPLTIHTEHIDKVTQQVTYLADKLEAGSLLGMASVVFCKGGKHEILISGLACEYPDMTNALAVRMISELLKL